MSQPRPDIARSTAARLREIGAQGVADTRALVGFDGFIDVIIRVVGRRHSMDMNDFESIDTIADFAARVGAAAGRSANIELVVEEERFGGNGPLFAGALGALGAGASYIGAVGCEEDHRTLHPLYADFAARCRTVFPIAPPSHTDALEFEDGKLMLGKTRNSYQVTWDRIVDVVGLEKLIAICDESVLIGMVNWVLVPGVEGIWQGLLDHVFPRLSDRPRRIYVDLSDPAKRSDADVRRTAGFLTRMNEHVPLTLGLNLAEAERFDHVFELGAITDRDNRTLGRTVMDVADAIRARLDLTGVVVHPREGAGASLDHERAWFDGPFTARPRLSTGAGDHFNGGFALGCALDFELPQALALGCAVSGAYVRDGASPTLDRLTGFLDDLPEPDRC